MRKHAIAVGLSTALLLLFTSGCGIIGGAFEEPALDETPWNPFVLPVQTPEITESIPTPESTAVEVGGENVLPANCVDALTISLENVGQTLCVGGKANLAYMQQGTYYVDFSPAKASFYMVGYDWKSRFTVKPGDCVYAEGKIVRVGNAPVMGINPATLLKCPAAGEGVP
jgi:hypothetical protein